MRGVIRSAAFAMVTCSTSAAWATAPGGQISYDPESVSYTPPPTERRSGFAMAITQGYGLGVYRGYELSVDALNDPEAEQSTGPAFATQTSLWFGGSPRDFLTAGLGVSLLSARNEAIGGGMAFLAHVELFPLFFLGGTFHDLGLGLDGGLGIVSILENGYERGDKPIAESGSLSTLGLSVFWEPIRFWHLSMGPTVGWVHGFSQTMQVNQVTLGFRTALYGVQPRKKKGAGS